MKINYRFQCRIENEQEKRVLVKQPILLVMELISESYGSESEFEDLEETIETGEEKQLHIPNEVIYTHHKEPIVNPMNKYLSSPIKRKVQCFFFLEIRLNMTQQRILDSALFDVNNVMHSFGENAFEPTYRGKLGTLKPLHVSLSSSILYDSDMEFKECLERVESKLQSLRPYDVPVRFSGTWGLYPNFDSSIWFLSLACDTETKKKAAPLLQTINDVTKAATDSAHIKFMENLHMSIAMTPNWASSLDSVNKEKQQRKLEIQRNILQTHAGGKLPMLRSEFSFTCKNIMIQSGATVLSMPLD